MDKVSFDAEQHFAAAQAPSGAPLFLAPVEGLMQLWVFGILVTLKISGNETAGVFAVHEDFVPPGNPGPYPHAHMREDEYWYMTEGELTWIVDGNEYTATRDSFMHVRRGVVHTLQNRSGKYARMLVMYTPAKFQEWFIKVGVRTTKEASVTSFPGPVPTKEEYKKALQLLEVYGATFQPPGEHEHEQVEL